MKIPPGPLLGPALAIAPAEYVKYIRCPAQLKRQTESALN
jgi:hypothetical protein